VTLIELQKVWGIGLFLQGQQLITGMGSSWEFASSIRDDLKTTPEKRVRLIGHLNATDFF
jgi:hypothetical protein